MPQPRRPVRCMASFDRAPAATSSNARPDSSCRATPPVNACQRRTITSQYFGSNSITRACRPVFSQAMIVVPLPPNGSRIVSRDLAVVPERALDQLHRLHRRVLAVGRRPVDLPRVALVPVAAPIVRAALAPAVQDRLVLSAVVSPAQSEVVLRPRSRTSDQWPPASEERLAERVQLRRGHADVHRALAVTARMLARGVPQEVVELATRARRSGS